MLSLVVSQIFTIELSPLIQSSAVVKARKLSKRCWERRKEEHQEATTSILWLSTSQGHWDLSQKDRAGPGQVQRKMTRA